MNCPKCNHHVERHRGPDIGHIERQWRDELGRRCTKYCECLLSEAEALRAAQRHAAAVRLRELHSKAWRMFKYANEFECLYGFKELDGYMQALKDCGISRKAP